MINFPTTSFPFRSGVETTAQQVKYPATGDESSANCNPHEKGATAQETETLIENEDRANARNAKGK